MSKADFMQAMKDKLVAEEKRLAKKEAALKLKKEKELRSMNRYR